MVTWVSLWCGLLAQADTASFAGTVIDGASGTPLAGVELRLSRIAQNSVDSAPYGARSGEGGRFSIAALPPGNYVVVPRRAGYLPDLFAPDSDNGMVRLQPRQQMTNAVVRMAAQAVIAGRVLDEQDRPVTNGYIELESPENPMAVNSTLRYFVFNGDRTTPLNERGEYRVGVPPGRYRVRAVSIGFEDAYFPSAADVKSSTPVETAAGRETGNIDIRMRRRAEFTLSGEVTADGEVAKFFVYARNIRGEVKHAMVEGRRTFQIAGLSPGKYLVHAYEGSLRLLSETLEIDLQDNRSGLTIALREPFTVTGKLRAPVGVDLSRSLIYLEALIAINNQPVGGRKSNSSAIRDGGTFAITNVMPGSYRVRGDELPGDLYVKTVKQGDALVPGGLLPLKETRAVELDVTLGPGASVSGVMSDAQGPLAEGSVLVVLGPAERPTMAAAHKMLLSANGQYRFGNLAPGRYHLLARRVARLPDEAQMSEWLAKAPVIEVKEGDRLKHDLTEDARP